MKLFKYNVVGLDIDGMEIRVVELSGTFKNPVIRKIGKTYLPEGAVKEGKILDPEKVGEAVSELWKKNRIGSRDVILGANNTDVIVRFAPFPKLPKEKLDSLISYQASDYLPFSLDDVEFDYSIISEVKNNDRNLYNVLLVAARKDMLYNFIKAMSYARITILDIKSSVLVMDKLLPEKHKNDVVVLVNLCFESYNILIMDKNLPAFARTITLSGPMHDAFKAVFGTGCEAMTENVQNANNLDDKLKNDIDSIIRFIAGDIRSSVAYYQSQNKNSGIEKVYLIGCMASNTEIVEGLKNSIGIYIEVLRPYKHLYEKLPEQYRGEEKATEFAIAFSLALHGLEE